MSFETAEVELISLDGEYVLLDDGECLPVTNWINEDFEECKAEDAVLCFAGRDGYGWLSIEINEPKVLS